MAYKGRVIETVTGKGGVEIKVRYDKNQKVFFYTEGSQHWHGTDIQEGLAKARQDVRALAECQWVPIIEVNYVMAVGITQTQGGPRVKNREVKYYFLRYYVSSGLPTQLMIQWDAPGYQTLKGFDLHHWRLTNGGYSSIPMDDNRAPILPSQKEGAMHGWTDKVFLPYSEKTWVSLEQFAQALDTLDERLRDLFFSDSGIARLQSGVMELIASPTHVVDWNKGDNDA